MNKLMDILKLIVAAAGGGAVAAWVIIKFLGKTVAGMVVEGYKSSLNKEEEKVKSVLTTKMHVTQMHYDKTFCNYQEITEALYKTMEILFDLIPQDGDLSCYPSAVEERKKHIGKFQGLKDEFNNTYSLVKKSGPLISKELNQSYTEILQLIKKQIAVFSSVENSGVVNNLKEEDYNRSKEIEQKFDIISEQIRQYLASIEVQ